jgi:hypothetical protein
VDSLHFSILFFQGRSFFFITLQAFWQKSGGGYTHTNNSQEVRLPGSP